MHLAQSFSRTVWGSGNEALQREQILPANRIRVVEDRSPPMGNRVGEEIANPCGHLISPAEATSLAWW
jgi:hypothetical protein